MINQGNRTNAQQLGGTQRHIPGELLALQSFHIGGERFAALK